MKRRKVLVVCMFDSVHSGRWLEQFLDEDIDFCIFPSKKYKHMNAILSELESSTNCAKYEFPTLKFTKRYSGYIDFLFFVVLKKYFKIDLRRIMLSKIINRSNFDFIHALEIQGAGYLCTDAIAIDTSAEFIVTNWGSDIYYFSKFPEHVEKIKKVLARATMYSGECVRDYKLANALGFSKRELPCIPNAGGFDINLSLANKIPTSKRKKVVIKGYGGEFGRVKIVIECVGMLLAEGLNYEFCFYSITEDVLQNITILKSKYPANITFSTRRKPIPRQELLSLFADARVFVGASISDGISTSFLEALTTRTYPIQTDTSCANEWVQMGIEASIVKVEKESIYNAMRLALTDDLLVDHRSEKNLLIASKYLTKTAVSKKAINYYKFRDGS